MKKYIFYSIIIYALFIPSSLYTASFVYNLRIAETTKRQAFIKKSEHPFTTVLVPVAQFRKKHRNIRQLYCGGLATFIYTTEHFYGRADWAAAYARQKQNGISSAHTFADDLLLSAGYSHAFDERLKMTISLMFGIPMHKDDLLQYGYEFGTGHIGLGPQLDAAYTYSPAQHHSLMAAIRVIHFFPRSTPVAINATTTVPYSFTIGNLLDIFIAHRSTWKKHKLEFGYNPTFDFHSRITPYLAGITSMINFNRNSFYSTYTYGFSIGENLSALTFGLSYGSDTKPKLTGNEYNVTCWMAWGINF
ncbi:MAG TPA: hypothetical protein VEK38_04025 [Candidatus Bathyarchaeia archaeon]|nr:hypothetical protein [Candidatus Bathyarchaeia archaeon]